MSDDWKFVVNNKRMRKHERIQEKRRDRECPDYEDIRNLLMQNGIVWDDSLKMVWAPWAGTEIHLNGNGKYKIYVCGKLATDDEHPGKLINYD